MDVASDIATVPRPIPVYCCPKEPGKAEGGCCEGEGEGLGIGEAGTPIAMPPLCCPEIDNEEEEEDAGADEEDNNGEEAEEK